jgi:hypothetical protein
MAVMGRFACIAVVLALGVSAAPAVGATPRQFSGTGGRTLAPFQLAHASTLRWQTSGGLLGGPFALKLVNRREDVPNPQLVFSRVRSGTVRLQPGRYALRVDALPGTRWQITVA